MKKYLSLIATGLIVATMFILAAYLFVWVILFLVLAIPIGVLYLRWKLKRRIQRREKREKKNTITINKRDITKAKPKQLTTNKENE